MTGGELTAIFIGAAGLVTALCTGIAAIITALGTKRAIAEVKDKQVINAVTLDTIEKNTNSAATAAKTLEATLRAELKELRAQFAEGKQTAALLAQAHATAPPLPPAEASLDKIAKSTDAIDQNTKPPVPTTPAP